MDASPPVENAMLSVPEAARLLGIDVRTTRAACKSGEIYAVKIGGRLLVPRATRLAILEPRPNGGAA
jgi:excisionase family DNA binding protein